jgi:HPt (histidine-containing phosphotransfer) domain-containing protein
MGNDSKVMDPQKIEEFQSYSDGNNDFIIELFEKYLDNSKSLIRKIRNSHQAKDLKQMLLDIHAFKGSSKNMGLTKIGQFITDLEKDAKDNGIRDFSPELKKLDEHFQEVQNFFSENFK